VLGRCLETLTLESTSVVLGLWSEDNNINH
jgi:hypothetical protein